MEKENLEQVIEQENAYMGTTKEIGKGKKAKKALKIFMTLALAGATFLGGAMTTWACLDEEMRLLIKVKNTIDAQYYKELDDEVFYKEIFDAVNGQLDAYSYYMQAEEYQTSADNLNGKRIGLGVTLSSSAIQSGKIQVARVCGNSPAEEAGLRSGDRILA